MAVLRTSLSIVAALALSALLCAPAGAVVRAGASVATTSTELGAVGKVRLRAWSCGGPLGRWQLRLTHFGGWKGAGTASWSFSALELRAAIDGSYPVRIPVPGIDGVRFSYAGTVALERGALWLRLALSWASPSGVRSEVYPFSARVRMRAGEVSSCLRASVRAHPGAIT